MISPPKQPTEMDDKALQDMVAANDTGARIPKGWQGAVLLGTALIWSLFQLWIASPSLFMIGQLLVALVFLMILKYVQSI
ncbi:hypothetical protein [Psychromonas sp. GE-S-Ul-11]|uniref:hypothetical protein n=1 Tax=Psychromonas sp. GE-S-Ul-11 TaxID=3241170 RepID=UPI003AAC28E9